MQDGRKAPSGGIFAMHHMGLGFYVFMALLVLAALYLIGIYNGLVTARNSYKNAFAQIDVQLTRRHDLIPNLVETAKAYLAHEHSTLEAVMQARNAAVSGLANAKRNPGDPGAMEQLSASEDNLTQSLGRLFAVSESYPDLKADQTMMQLSEEITSTENRVAFARQAYNDSVMTYNNRCEVFPNSFIAGSFSFTEAKPLQIEDTAMRAVPKVSFG
jgi:LemA protein